MKRLLRSFLITAFALWITSQVLPTFVITSGFRGFIIGTLAFMLANILLIPLLKILLLPLNLLTLGIFAWLSNVLALYILVSTIATFQVSSYFFEGADLNGFIIPALELTPFYVVVFASFSIGCIIHFINWLTK